MENTSDRANKFDDTVSVAGLISPVSSPKSSKRNAIIILFVLILLMLAWTILSNHKQKMPIDNSSQLKPNYNPLGEDAAKVGPFKDSNTETFEKLTQMQKKLDIEKMAQAQKLYRMRQAAPINMYELNASTVNANTALLSTSNSMNHMGSDNALESNLPLTAAQINKLRNLMGANDSNLQFQQTASNTPVQTNDATRIPHVDYTVTQGSLIPGILQTALNSDLPGMIKANVSMDIYAQSGARVLIPKGSLLIGEYNAGVSMGQRRVFVVWTRLIRPDGIDIRLGSSGTDQLGQSGLGADKLETRFWARFGQATLLSIISAGIANVGVDSSDQFNSSAAYRTAIADSFNNSAGATLMSSMNIKPTIHINQGARINVFVSRDLSFFSALNNQL